jgi:hypothetical protein
VSAFRDDMTLREARDRLRELVDEGATCPCCTQNARAYRRKLTSVAARFVIALLEECDRDWGFAPDIARKRMSDVAHQGGQIVLGHHWGLIEEERRTRSDGGRSGWWRVTALGELWACGEETVPMYARIYDGRRLGLHGDLVTVTDVLGEGFDFGHLVRAVTPRAERQQDEPLFPDQEAA